MFTLFAFERYFAYRMLTLKLATVDKVVGTTAVKATIMKI